MRIFLSFLQGKTNHPISAYSFWEYYIKNGIEEAGHSWVEATGVDWALGLVPQSKESFAKWKTEAWEKTVHLLQLNQVDLFLSYLYPQQVDESAIEKIKEKGIPCVNFFCDHVRMFSHIPNAFKVFNTNWVPEYKALSLYKNAGYPCVHLPMPMWVSPEHRNIALEETSKISFIGSRDIQRHLFFESLVEKHPDIPLEIFGNAWQNQQNNIINNKAYSKFDQIIYQVDFLKKNGLAAYMRKILQRKLKPVVSNFLQAKLKGKPDFKAYIKITKESLITLGINRYPDFRFPLDNPNTYSRLRDIEAPMLGACYLTEWTEGLDSLYEIGQEILIYKNVDELYDQFIRLKKDKELRKNIRNAGQKRALHAHSIPASINHIVHSLR